MKEEGYTTTQHTRVNYQLVPGSSPIRTPKTITSCYIIDHANSSSVQLI